MFFRLYLPPGSGRLRQPATIDPTLDLCTRYPLRLGGPRQCGIRSLPDTSTHGQHWESNPRPSDLESNALSTWPRAPKLITICLENSFKRTDKLSEDWYLMTEWILRYHTRWTISTTCEISLSWQPSAPEEAPIFTKDFVDKVNIQVLEKYTVKFYIFMLTTLVY